MRNSSPLARKLLSDVPITPDSRGSFVDHVANPARVRDILVALASHGVSGYARTETTTVPITLESAEGGLLVFACARDIDPMPFAIELVGYNAVFHFLCGHAEQSGGRLRVAMPWSLLRVRRRWLKRHEVTGNLVAARARTGATRAFQAELLNLSYEGLALRDLAPLERPAPGTPLAGLVVSDGEHQVEIDAEVRWSAPAPDGRGAIHGLKVTRSDGGWTAIVDDQIYPRTAPASGYPEQTWALFGRTGYFRLFGKAPEDFTPLKQAFFRSNLQLDGAPQLGHVSVWRTGDEVSATAAVSKIYQGTWMGYQLAKLGGDAPDGTSSRRVMRELLCRQFEQIQRDPQFRWFATYVETKEVWTHFAFVDNARAFVEDGEAAIIPLHAYELDTNARRAPGLDRIEVATATDRVLLAYHVTRTRSAAYGDAFDLGPESIHFAATRRSWRAQGFTRDRGVLVARDGGRVVAAAVVESGAEGVHLLNQLDIVRLYALEPVGERFHAALLEGARAWFRRAGRGAMILLKEQEVRVPPEVLAQGRDLGAVEMVLIAARRVPEVLETLHQLLAPRRAGEPAR